MSIFQLLICHNNRTQTVDIQRREMDTLTVQVLKQKIISAELLTTLKQPTSLNVHTPMRKNGECSELHTLALADNFRLIQCNKELCDSELVKNRNLHHVFHFKVRIVGGKGGFGATLKSQKPKNPMTMNFDACRDLNGRRIRHVRAEQELERWNKEREEEDKKIEQELEEFRKHEREINRAIKSNDRNKEAQMNRFMKQCELSAGGITNSVMLGKQRMKRKARALEKLGTGNEKSLSNSDGENGEFDEEAFFQTSRKPSKRVKTSENEEVQIEKEESKEPEKEPQETQEPEESLMVPQKEPEKEAESVDKVVKQQEDQNAVSDKPEVTPSKELCNEKPAPTSPKQTSEEAKAKLFTTLSKAESVEELKKFYSTEQVKDMLVLLGLKAGGRPEERAERLYSVKGCNGDLTKLPKKMFAKKKN